MLFILRRLGGFGQVPISIHADSGEPSQLDSSQDKIGRIQGHKYVHEYPCSKQVNLEGGPRIIYCSLRTQTHPDKMNLSVGPVGFGIRQLGRIGTFVSGPFRSNYEGAASSRNMQRWWMDGGGRAVWRDKVEQKLGSNGAGFYETSDVD